MLTSIDAFKVGFLERCAAEGLGAQEIAKAAAWAERALAKSAGLLDSAVKGIGGGLASLAPGAASLAILAPPVLGMAGGMAAAKLTDMDDTDVEGIKNQELIDAYRHHAEQLRRQHLVRRYHQLRQGPSSAA